MGVMVLLKVLLVSVGELVVAEAVVVVAFVGFVVDHTVQVAVVVLLHDSLVYLPYFSILFTFLMSIFPFSSSFIM